jgi:hypothetical protein
MLRRIFQALRPHWPALMGIMAAGDRLVLNLTGHPMSPDTQDVWVILLAAWIGIASQRQNNYDKEVRLRKKWKSLSEKWQELYMRSFGQHLQRSKKEWN